MPLTIDKSARGDRDFLHKRLATQFAQRPQFIALDRMHRCGAAFEPAHVEVGAIEVDLTPFEINGLTDPQAVAGHEQDQRRITMPIAALTRGADQFVE